MAKNLMFFADAWGTPCLRLKKKSAGLWMDFSPIPGSASEIRAPYRAVAAASRRACLHVATGYSVGACRNQSAAAQLLPPEHAPYADSFNLVREPGGAVT